MTRWDGRAGYLGILFVALLACTSSCNMAGDLKEAMVDAKRAEAALASQLGADAAVGFNIHNGHATVTVYLRTIPEGSRDLRQFKERLSGVIRQSFARKVDSVVVSF